MKHEKEFREFIEALKTEKLPIPEDFSNEFDNVLLPEECPWKTSETLDLDTGIAISLEYDDIKGVGLADAFKGILRCREIAPIVLFNPLYFYGDGSYKVEPRKWKNLPKHYKEQANLIQKLDDFIPRDENSKSARDMDELIESKGRKKSWSELYAELVTKGKLKWADILGEKFPYVTTDSKTLGNVGRSVGGLYFVSTDIAKEPWQEKIVAYHERFCQAENHQKAKERELALAKELGKEREHGLFRELVDEYTKNGRFV